jgi:hypothetical protein
MELFTTTLDLYGGVLWSGELQGFIIQQMMPIIKNDRAMPNAMPGGFACAGFFFLPFVIGSL